MKFRRFGVNEKNWYLCPSVITHRRSLVRERKCAPTSYEPTFLCVWVTRQTVLEPSISTQWNPLVENGFKVFRWLPNHRKSTPPPPPRAPHSFPPHPPSTLRSPRASHVSFRATRSRRSKTPEKSCPPPVRPPEPPPLPSRRPGGKGTRPAHLLPCRHLLPVL